jgi:hypothetical protein
VQLDLSACQRHERSALFGSFLPRVASSVQAVLLSYDPEFEEDMAIARKVMRDNRDALRELAK